jgi:hypothetical protein
MKKKLVVVVLFLWTHLSDSRSLYRPVDPKVPMINARWADGSTVHSLKKYHLEEYALFQLFDKKYFEEHMLPSYPIASRYDPEKTVHPLILQQLIEGLLAEISDGKKSYTHFLVLQSKDYNFKKGRGLLIVKFKDYPFVVKLFVETPDSFVSPFDKGMEPIFFFFMGGGVNRHLTGFTRIKNREIIKEKLAQSPWADKVDIPRKWHWVPRGTRWIEIEGINIGNKPHQKIQFPGTYCIIADAIDAERNLSLLNESDKKLALEICNYLNLWIDPHMKNFMYEKGSGKFVIVDTEHFPSAVGLHEKITFDNYSNWYLHLAGKCWQNAFMQTKSQRRNPSKHNPEMNLLEYKGPQKVNHYETYATCIDTQA